MSRANRRLLGLGKASWASIGLAALVLAGIWVHLEAQRRKNDLETKSETHSAARLHRIYREIGALGPRHPWAGEYSTGPGLTGTTFAIAPKTGYVVTDWGCTGSDTTSGSFTEKNGILEFGPLAYFRFQDGLRVVRWGHDTYLIPLGDLSRFANDVNDGYWPGYWRRERPGEDNGNPMPDLPEPEHRLLRKTPLEARIVTIGALRDVTVEWLEGRPPNHKWTADVLLDAGRDKGALPGLRLRTQGIEGEATIIKAYDDYSIAAYESNDFSPQAPNVGGRLTTRRFTPNAEPGFRISTRTLAHVSPLPASRWIRDLETARALAAARKAGFSVSPVVRITVRSKSSMLTYSDFQKNVEPLLSAGGANAYIEHRAIPGKRPSLEVIDGYRFEWHGQVLERLDFPFDEKGWRKAGARVRLNHDPFALSLVQIRYKAMEQLLHMSIQDYDRLDELRLEFLTQEQRDALSKYLGIHREFGTLRDGGGGRSGSETLWKAVEEVQKPAVNALEAADPTGHARYARLSQAARD